MEESDMWRLSSGSANWRLSGSDSIAMENEVSRMSGGLLRLSLSGDNNSFRNLVDSPVSDGVLTDGSPLVKAGDDDPRASLTMHADEADLSALPPPPVPVRGVARTHLPRPLSSDDMRGLSAVLAEAKDTPPQHPG